MTAGIKTAKIIKLTHTGSMSMKDGKINHFHDISFENGDLGSMCVVESNLLNLGEGFTIKYEEAQSNQTHLDGSIKRKFVFKSKEQVPEPSKKTNPVSNPAIPQKDFTKMSKKNPQDAITFILGYASNRHVALITATKKDIPLNNMLEDAKTIYDAYKEMLNQ